MNRFSFIFSGLVYKALQANLNVRVAEPKTGLAVYTNDHLGLYAVIFGRYEGEILDEVIKFLSGYSSLDLCIDAGANMGNHSLEFSKLFKHVIAFEPNPEVLPLLTINLRQTINTEIAPLALSNSSKVKMLLVDHVNSGRTCIENNSKKAHKTIPIRCTKLDDYLGTKRRKVNFIKIDVEGHETELLQGALKTLNEGSPVVMLEVLSQDIENGEAKSLNFLKSCGYHKFFHVCCEPTWWTVVKDVSRKLYCHNLLDVLKCLFCGPPKASIKQLDIKNLKKIDYATVLAKKT